MSPRQAPTLRAVWLGQQLHQLRLAAGLTLREVGEFLHRSQGTVSRFESGEYPIRRPEVMALLDLYHVNDQRQRTALLRFAEEVWQTGWWDGYAGDVADWFVDYMWLESRARQFQSFDTTVLPGLLQTEEYAATAMRLADPDITDEQLARGVELRMTRQERLAGNQQLWVSAVLDEALLRRGLDGPSVMRAQLAHLLERVQWPNIEIRVLPFLAGVHVIPANEFKLFTMDDPHPRVAYLETLTGALYIEPPEVDHYVRAYDRLWKQSLGAKESAELISAAMEDAK